MLTILHVFLAVLCIAIATTNFFKPAQNWLAVSYGLTGSTLLSGVLLIVFNDASIIRTCVTGVAFLVIVSTLNELTRSKLTALSSKNTA